MEMVDINAYVHLVLQVHAVKQVRILDNSNRIYEDSLKNILLKERNDVFS
jgi:hypothetical protein